MSFQPPGLQAQQAAQQAAQAAQQAAQQAARAGQQAYTAAQQQRRRRDRKARRSRSLPTRPAERSDLLAGDGGRISDSTFHAGYSAFAADVTSSPASHGPSVQPIAADEAGVLAAARDVLEQGDWGESRLRFTELKASRSPVYAADARYGLGWIELQQGSQDHAAALFREATEYNAQHANAWYARGRLAEARSTADAIAYYRRALGADSSHYGAAQRVRELSQSEEPSTANEARSTPTPSPAPPPDPGQAGVAEFLRRDNSPLAQQTLARIDSLNRTNRFCFSAYLQHLLARLVLLVGAVALISYVLFHVTPLTLGSHTVHFYSGNVRQAIVGAALVWAAWAVWTLLDCVTNTVTLANARIRWTHGVFNKHTETLDVWTARDIELDRNLLQRITRDGTLTFKGTLHDRASRLHKGQFKPLRLTGIERGQELDDIYALLLDLKFLLRANQSVKGIIQ